MEYRVPTIHDLRVKLCYICREEEVLGAEPEDPPREWTHPCKCTLVAHESCLLRWIQASQSDYGRAPNALRCPQCGSTYELISDDPMMLRILRRGNRFLERIGRTFTIFGIVGVMAVFGSGVYVILTGYGAYAVKQFLGKEMFDLLLTDDPANWPWAAFFNFPTLTLSLIGSRFHTVTVPNFIPILFAWPLSSPVGIRSRLFDQYWTNPDNASKLALNSTASPLVWPPSPAVFAFFVVPLTRMIYNHCLSYLQYRTLGARPTSPAMDGGHGWQLGEGFFIRIRANVVNENNRRENDRRENRRGNNLPMLGQLRRPQEAEAQEQPQQPPAADVEQGDREPDAAALAAAEQLISFDTSSFGRKIGGALLIPAISSMMGSFLSRLSKRSTLLRRFLGVRPPLNGLLPPPLGPYTYDSNWRNLNLVQRLGLSIRLVMNATWHGTKTWAEADPVWWRNSVGLGLFIVAKDCLQLVHLWLAKRELESRRVRSRDFQGVDIKELDLVPNFPRPPVEV